MIIQTSRYKMGRGKFARSLMRHFGLIPLVCLAAVTIILAIAGIFDLRYAILGLMVVFLVTPMLLVLLYFNHALRPLTSVNVAEHSIEFRSDKLVIRIYGSQHENEDGNKEKSEPELLATREIGYEDVKGYESDQKSVTLMLKDSTSPTHSGLRTTRSPGVGPALQYLWIPVSAFTETCDFRKAMELTFK